METKKDLLSEANRILRSTGASARVGFVPGSKAADYTRKRNEAAVEIVRSLPPDKRKAINTSYREARLNCQTVKSYAHWLADYLEQSNGLSLQ